MNFSKIISGVYIPFWFLTKKDSLWFEAPRNYVFLLKKLRRMPKKVQDIVKETVQRGAWSCHEETGKAKLVCWNLLLRCKIIPFAVLQSMLCSSDEVERHFAIRKIR